MAFFELELRSQPAHTAAQNGPSIAVANTEKTPPPYLELRCSDQTAVTVAVGALDAAGAVRDIAHAVDSVLLGRATTAHACLPEDLWELCFSIADNALALSLYRAGPVPEVHVLDAAVSASEIIAALRYATERLEPFCTREFSSSMSALLARATTAANRSLTAPARGPATLVRWRSRDRHQGPHQEPSGPVELRFEAVVTGSVGPRPENARADLHALLCTGRVGLCLRAQRIDLSQGFVVLHLERLVALCRPLIESTCARRAMHLRVNVADVSIALRLGADQRLAVSISRTHETGITAPTIDPRDFILPILDGALALAAAMVRCDRSLGRNLRLRALRAEARGLKRWLRDLDRVDTKLNDDPMPYVAITAEEPSPAVDLTSAQRLRYSPRWRAEIEGLDLSGTLLCGDRLVVPGTRELHALDRLSGASVWSVSAPRAQTTLAGEGLLRVGARGEVEYRAVSTGEVVWSSRVAPRVGARVLAMAVSSPGIPALAVLAEGERRLIALDLRTGEARWTYTARHSGAFKLRRVGRLLIVVSGDAAVTALDLVTGEKVWRFGDRVPFNLAPVVHGDTVYAVAGEGARGAARLYAVEAYTGALKWCAEARAPLCCPPAVTSATVAMGIATRDGVTLLGIDPQKGTEKFQLPLGVLPGVGAARPAVSGYDEMFVANLPTGRVVSIDAEKGTPRWTQTFRAPVADDVPRRLDVQLRAGALFVPQCSLAVLRPRDGSVLAEVDACDLVPDLVRIDEQCALYVAEESGHLGAFELGARLRVLRPV